VSRWSSGPGIWSQRHDDPGWSQGIPPDGATLAGGHTHSVGPPMLRDLEDASRHGSVLLCERNIPPVGDGTMHRRSFITGGAALVATAMPRVAMAQRSGWVLLGSRPVNWAAGRDSIMVHSGMPIRDLSFRTRGGELFITSVAVSFSGGAHERVPLNARVRPNTRSNVVRLREPRSDIHRIDYSFRRAMRAPPPGTRVEVFGRR